MAISLVGSATGGSSNGGAVTIDLSSISMLEGDLVIVWGGFQSSGGTPNVLSSGYSVLQSVVSFNQSAGIKSGAWYKFMGATPDSSISCQPPTGSLRAAAYGAYVLRGVDVDVLDNTVTVEADGAGYVNPAAVTTTTTSAWVLVLVADTSSQGTLATAAPTGYGNLVAATHADSYDQSVAGATKTVASPGVENPGNFTWSSGFSGRDQIVFTIAVRAEGAFAGPEAPELSVNYNDTDATLSTTGFVAHDDATDETHHETQWQITTDADTAFASPFVDVITTVYLLAYIAEGVLDPGTAYRARARHVGYVGGEGEWSNVVEFTTEDSAPRPATPVLTVTNVEEDEVTLTVSAFAV